MKEKFKLIIENDKLFYGLLVIFMSITSFGLGRTSATHHISTIQSETDKPKIKMIEPITITANVVSSEQTTQNVTTTKSDTTNSSSHQFVASKNGTKYHLKSCSGAKNIKPENLISFPTREAAEAAGYTKAANCPGL